MLVLDVQQTSEGGKVEVTQEKKRTPFFRMRGRAFDDLQISADLTENVGQRERGARALRRGVIGRRLIMQGVIDGSGLKFSRCNFVLLQKTKEFVKREMRLDLLLAALKHADIAARHAKQTPGVLLGEAVDFTPAAEAMGKKFVLHKISCCAVERC